MTKRDFLLSSLSLLFIFLQTAQAEFTCRDGQVIRSSSKCDAHIDCKDGSDETFAECYSQICPEHKCSYGGCYNDSQRCDGKSDCFDGTDEHSSICSGNQNHMHSEGNDSVLRCPENTLKCKSTSECLDVKFFCDGIKDCQDGSDETNGVCLNTKCPNDTFRCAYGGCLPKEMACDGKINCWDKSDEEHSICIDISGKLEIGFLSESQNRTSRTTTMISRSGMDTSRIFNYISGCTVPGNLKNLQVKTLFNVLPYKVGTRVAESSVVQLSCSENTKLYGSNLNHCLNGKWQGPWPDCIGVCHRMSFTRDPSIRSTCRYNGDTKDCSLRDTTLFVGTTANVTCASSYKPRGPVSWQTRTCIEVPSAKSPVWSMESKINRLECIPECGIILPAVKDIPWIVSLFTNGINMSNFIFRCLGNIVSSYSILVEKQCIDTDDVMRYSIVIGEHKVAFNDYDASPYRVRFIESIYKSRHNALLSIADPFIFSPLVRPICIPPIRQWYALSSNSTAYTYEKLIKINYLINIEDDIRQEINLVQQHNRLNIRDM